MPEIGSLLSIYKIVEQMIDEGKVLAAATPGYGGVPKHCSRCASATTWVCP